MIRKGQKRTGAWDRCGRIDCKHADPACPDCIVRREYQRKYRAKLTKVPARAIIHPTYPAWGEVYLPDAPF